MRRTDVGNGEKEVEKLRREKREGNEGYMMEEVEEKEDRRNVSHSKTKSRKYSSEV